MKTLWDPNVRDEMMARIERVQDGAAPRWGRMTSDRMLCHLVESLKMATGDITVKSKKLPLRYFPLKQLIVYLLPFPKGAPTAPELLAGGDAACTVSHAEVRRLMAKFVAQGIDAPRPEHPAFGKLSGKQWGILTYRHFDHHLRQFGA